MCFSPSFLMFLILLYGVQGRVVPIALDDDIPGQSSIFFSCNIASISVSNPTAQKQSTENVHKSWFSVQWITFYFEILHPSAKKVKIAKADLTVGYTEDLMILKIDPDHIRNDIQYIQPVRRAFEKEDPVMIMNFFEETQFFYEYYVIDYDSTGGYQFVIQKQDIVIHEAGNNQYYALGVPLLTISIYLNGSPVFGKHLDGSERLFGVILDIQNTFRIRIKAVANEHIERIVSNEFENNPFMNPRFIIPIIWDEIRNVILPSILIRHRVTVTKNPEIEITGINITFKFDVLHPRLQSREVETHDLGVFSCKDPMSNIEFMVIILPADIIDSRMESLLNPITTSPDIIATTDDFKMICGIRGSATKMFIFCEAFETFHHNVAKKQKPAPAIQEGQGSAVLVVAGTVTLIEIRSKLSSGAMETVAISYTSTEYVTEVASLTSLHHENKVRMFLTRLETEVKATSLTEELANVRIVQWFLIHLAGQMVIKNCKLYQDVVQMVTLLHQASYNSAGQVVIINNELLNQMQQTSRSIRKILFV